MVPSIDGPRLAPLSGKTRQIIIILHGFGANGDDLIEIGRQWQPLFPDAAFVAPHAHEACPGAPGGRQWFTLTDRNPNERWAGACSAQSVVDAFIDMELSKAGLDMDRLALVGFSQGAMLALHTGLRRRKAPAAILAYSGMLIGPEHASGLTARDAAGKPPPVLLVHGHQDNVVPVQSMFLAGNQLAEVEIPCQWHLAPGLGHSIDHEGIRHGACFLSNAFGMRTPDLRTQEQGRK
ncbi:MAG: alpha/beta hydrolase [Beijerinckiaceae bacterium]|jgi:phospholipase/carboxylesterase|nr:alpha/beta hydrolase [Beijerinckiaceae bacterium]